ncbi:MAG: hypothetical protein ACREQ3_23900, partial [Candidatus Binatia bacterium]
TPLSRCPSDGWELQDGRLFNYVASTGPQCNNPSGGCASPFQLHCINPATKLIIDPGDLLLYRENLTIMGSGID